MGNLVSPKFCLWIVHRFYFYKKSMAQTKEQKQKTIEDLKEKVDRQKSMVFIDFQGVKVKDLSNLRKKIKEVGGQLKVAKKTLINLALKNLGFKLEKDLKGEIALIFAFEDSISPLKKTYQFSETNENLKILDGFFDGKFIEKEKVLTLAQLPNKEELLARLVGSISSPVSGFLNVLQGNLRGLVYILSQLKTNQ